MALKIINTEKFKAEIFDFTAGKDFEFQKTQPIILNFYATWCGPCHAFAPALEDIANDYKDQIQVYKIDIDQDPLIPALFEVRSVPTTVFFIPNQEPALAGGNLGKSGLERAIRELFGLSPISKINPTELK
jgi:thioredoxin